MEAVMAMAMGIMFGSGVWLLLRPRTFQVITGLLLISYAVNLFIFIMGRLSINQPPLTLAEGTIDPALKRRPNASGAGLNGDRDRLCHHSPLSGGDDWCSRAYRHRPR